MPRLAVPFGLTLINFGMELLKQLAPARSSCGTGLEILCRELEDIRQATLPAAPSSCNPVQIKHQIIRGQIILNFCYPRQATLTKFREQNLINLIESV